MRNGFSRRITFYGTFHPADRERDPYRLFQFEVPPGIKAIELRYDYDRERNTLDIGLFDPRGHEFPTAPGFRGWSGSVRDRVVVGESHATPGYLPGPIFPGTWHVILGLYRISPLSCNYKVEVRLLSEEDAGSPPVASEPEVGRMTGGWLRGDLHCHTCHSDAEGSVREVAGSAAKKGLQFLAITDHNTVSQWEEISRLRSVEGVLLIPGEEITTYRGHANVWGTGHWLDFRCRKAKQVEVLYRIVRDEGRPFSVNHPKPGGPPWEFGFGLPFDCLEVWHGMWAMGNEYSRKVWEDLLCRKRRTIAVGGSDAHPRYGKGGELFDWIGCPTTWVWAETQTVEAILEGIRKGRVSISACPHGPLVFLMARCCGETFPQGAVCPCGGDVEVGVEVRGGKGLKFGLYSAKGFLFCERVSDDHWRKMWPLNLKEEGFIRAELRVPMVGVPWGKWPMAAITNPVWHEDFLTAKRG